ncbi:phosphoenolpyruvate--protein phosphotransferase [Ancylothrix sp. C2]|uniref:phosphoenolpyruvate--protein phosphotransferase n=1 Tax=Ancylothrix sp. D3o TaxID=2953691 RepID=UPI0021BACB53|nr:phosphoenolpyruvate--protein phosphotransferase [Ancylothrix sp. D3o]MCT7952427.1 phosphoenolpyruvate--protein phosphotransferase [Ancylothrix sp. D3o]
MIGIVIVSHSKKLAEGVQELANQMAQGRVRLAVAAGIDDPDNPLGTDAMQVYQAIESVWDGGGVVVLMDLGSALMSAEMALEFLSEEKRSNVRLCEAPLVEGTMAAVVAASAGGDIEKVLLEARGAMLAKAQFLGVNLQKFSAISPLENNGQLRETREFTIQNLMGLHARPAAQLVTMTNRFECEITLKNISQNSNSVNAKSINQVITLGVRQGDKILISAVGVDAGEALSALQALIASNFGEEVLSIPTTSPESKTEEKAEEKALLGNLRGTPASPGIAIGPVFLYQPFLHFKIEQKAENSLGEWENLQQAISTAKNDLESLWQKTLAPTGQQESAIFAAHLLYLEDPILLETTRRLIFQDKYSAAAAWKTVIDETIYDYNSIKDPYFQARGADVVDVGERVLRLLTGVENQTPQLEEAVILIAPDLSPSETVQLDLKKVLGICTSAGGATSHAAILARSLRIPAVMAVGPELLSLEPGTILALNGETGEVFINPDATQLEELQLEKDNELPQLLSNTRANEPTLTRDGRLIEVMANICGIEEAKMAGLAGADGIGLLRSEFLYFNKQTAPKEAEQVKIYEDIAKAIAPYPLIIRTLDIGGDKPLPYVNFTPETNPFLGWRGIRVLLEHPELFKTQLRAILRVSDRYAVKVMFPMISQVMEILAAKEILAETMTELRQEKIVFNEKIEVGIMIEVPAAVAMAERLAGEVNFFSIGTNDLSQYVMAADRNNPKVATLADGFSPAVLRMIQQTVKAAKESGIWVGVCGELASSALAIPILLGLGVDELSVNVSMISEVKKIISELSMAEAEIIAQDVLELDSAAAVREYVGSLFWVE